MITKVLGNSSAMSEAGLCDKADFDVRAIEDIVAVSPLSIDGDGCTPCAEALPVFGDLGTGGSFGTDQRTNDKTAIMFEINKAGGSITFELEKDCEIVKTLNNNDVGEYKAVGAVTGHAYKSYIIVDWYKVLHFAGLGVGTYRIKTTVVLFGKTNIYYSNRFLAQFFHDYLAQRTVKFTWTQNGFIKSGLDYTGMKFPKEMRVKGVFGNPDRSLEVNEMKLTDKSYEQIRTEVINKYLYQSELLTEPMEKVLSLDMMLANDITVYDYNLSTNFMQDVNGLKVRPIGFGDASYVQQTKYGVFTLEFGDRKDDHLKQNYK